MNNKVEELQTGHLFYHVTGKVGTIFTTQNENCIYGQWPNQVGTWQSGFLMVNLENLENNENANSVFL